MLTLEHHPPRAEISNSAEYGRAIGETTERVPTIVVRTHLRSPRTRATLPTSKPPHQTIDAILRRLEHPR